MTVVETMPPNEFLLKFSLERRMGEQYRPTKEVVHTHNAGALFQQFLKRMDDAKRLEDHSTKVIDVVAEPVPERTSGVHQSPNARGRGRISAISKEMRVSRSCVTGY
jgi:hypothetical protein